MNDIAMRILHVLDHSLPIHSGYSFRTAAILREQRALGWEPVAVTTPRWQPGSGYEEADGWRFHRTSLVPSLLDRVPLGRYVREMKATEARLAELCASFRPDVVHAHSPALNAIPALRMGRRAGIPVVYEMRALWEDAAVDHGTVREGNARYRAARSLESWALARVDHVTTICEGLRHEIVERGVPTSKVTVVPNAVDTEAFEFERPADADLRRKLGLTHAVVVGFAGSFYAYEGLDLLIDAVARLAAARRNLRLLLIGGGFQEGALRAQVAAQGLEDRVIFTGRVPHADVQRYYSLIDVLAYPRHRMRLTELVTPLKPLEAMAQGRILVASDVGGHRELIRDRETGFLFPAGDARALASVIERLLDSRDAWDPVRKNARRFVESERTWARSVARYADVYRSVLQAPHAAAVQESLTRG